MCAQKSRKPLLQKEMAFTVKCNTCNIVIDEMLTFVQNKLSVIDEDTLVKLCVSSFSSDEIKRSKSLLYDSLPTDKRLIKRKNQGKETRDLEDIVSLLKGTSKEFIPIFVAKDLEKLPPILFDHLDCTRLLKDQLIIKNEIKDIKSNYVTSEQLEWLKGEISKLKTMTGVEQSTPNRYRSININNRRGAYMDSGPIGLSHFDITLDENHSIHSNSSPSEVEGRKQQQNSSVITNQSTAHQPSEVLAGARQPIAETVRQSERKASPTTQAVATTQTTSTSEATMVHQLAPPNVNNNNSAESKRSYAAAMTAEGEWNVVQRRKPKPTTNYRYSGKTGSCSENGGKFRAAEVKVPIFISRVHKETTSDDIAEHIYSKLQEHVKLEKLSLKEQRDHNAYKFFVPENKLSMFMDDKLWPQGIVFRRFVHYKQRKIDKDQTVIGPTK